MSDRSTKDYEREFAKMLVKEEIHAKYKDLFRNFTIYQVWDFS